MVWPQARYFATDRQTSICALSDRWTPSGMSDPAEQRHCRNVVGDVATLTRLLTATFVGLVCHLETPHMMTRRGQPKDELSVLGVSVARRTGSVSQSCR